MKKFYESGILFLKGSGYFAGGMALILVVLAVGTAIATLIFTVGLTVFRAVQGG